MPMPLRITSKSPIRKDTKVRKNNWKKKFSSSIPSQKKVNTPLFLIIIYEYNIWKKNATMF